MVDAIAAAAVTAAAAADHGRVLWFLLLAVGVVGALPGGRKQPGEGYPLRAKTNSETLRHTIIIK